MAKKDIDMTYARSEKSTRINKRNILQTFIFWIITGEKYLRIKEKITDKIISFI